MRRARMTMAAAVAAVGLTGISGVVLSGAGAAPPQAILPDLVADAPDERAGLETDLSTGTPRLLLRFWGYVHNRGPGPLEIRGQRVGGTMTARQHFLVEGSLNSWESSPAELAYETADGHRHWHVQRIARYSLWNEGRTAEAAPSMKVGFCFGDSREARPPDPVTAPRAYERVDCGGDNPGATTLREGISAGWQDVYGPELPFQWVVVSDVQPGRYWLREDIDPDDIVQEADEANVPVYARTATVIPGHLAAPVNAGSVSGASPTTVTLGASSFGTPGPRRFRIVTPPAKGTLSVAPGTAFTEPTVTYTPSPGRGGADSFTYVALDANSPFPRLPAPATVTLRLPGEDPEPAVPGPGPGSEPAAVAIGGAPPSMTAGTSAKLTARVSGDQGGVTWRVDGVVGGNRTVGTISADGTYRAPTGVTRPRTVTITATSARGARDERRIRLLPRARAGAAAPTIAVKRGALGVGRLDRMVVASFRPAKAGVVRIAISASGHRVGSCRVRTPAGRTVTCRLKVRSAWSIRRVRVTASLLRGRRTVGTKSWRGFPRNVASRGAHAAR